MHFLFLFFFLLQSPPSSPHSLIQCIFPSVFHPSCTFPKHCQYHLDRIVWDFHILCPSLSLCLLDCVFLSAWRAQCLVWWKGISQTVVATSSALLPPLSLLPPLLSPLLSSLLYHLFFSFRWNVILKKNIVVAGRHVCLRVCKDLDPLYPRSPLPLLSRLSLSCAVYRNCLQFRAAISQGSRAKIVYNKGLQVRTQRHRAGSAHGLAEAECSCSNMMIVCLSQAVVGVLHRPTALMTAVTPSSALPSTLDRKTRLSCFLRLPLASFGFFTKL